MLKPSKANLIFFPLTSVIAELQHLPLSSVSRQDDYCHIKSQYREFTNLNHFCSF